MRIAAVENNIIIDAFLVPAGSTVMDGGRRIALPDGKVLAAAGTQFIQSEAAIGSARVLDGSFVLPPAPPPTKADLLAYLANKRWRVEVGGIVLTGQALPTDRERRSALKDAADKVRDGTLPEPINVSLGPGIYLSLTLLELDAMISAIAKHVQAAFSKEKAVGANIQAGMITNTAEIDAVAWPS